MKGGGPQIILCVCVFECGCFCFCLLSLALAFDVSVAKRSFAPLLQGYHTSRWPFAWYAIALHFHFTLGSLLYRFLSTSGRAVVAVTSAQINGCATYR